MAPLRLTRGGCDTSTLDSAGCRVRRSPRVARPILALSQSSGVPIRRGADVAMPSLT